MTEAARPKRGLWLTTWVAIRFMVFGVGGFVVLLLGSVLFMDFADRLGSQDPSHLLSGPLIIAGGFMMLFGVGAWRRWGYLCVFFSTPAVLIFLAILNRLAPNFERYLPLDKGLFIIFFAALMPVSYWFVQKYYKRREAALPSSVPAQPCKNQEVS